DGGGCHREDPPSLQRSYGRTRWRSGIRRVSQSLPELGQGLDPPVADCPAALDLRSPEALRARDEAGCRGVLHAPK
ncbi:MAG: hypothetical protein Q7J98_13575, partial [Kiritimatiellia bacterium]|nr:hypothetical protein [Kiritimatiellia bacterium]